MADFFSIFRNFLKKDVKETSTEELDQTSKKIETIRRLLAQYNLDLDPVTLEVKPLGILEPKYPKPPAPYYPDIEDLLRQWQYSKDQVDKVNFSMVIEDMDKLYYESPIFSRAMNFVADELLQTNYKSEPLEVRCKNKKLEKEIKDLFKRINIDKILQTAALDLVKYGNALFIILTDENGVSGLTPLNPKSLTDIYVFKPYEFQEKIQSRDPLLNSVLSDGKFQILSQIILEDISDYYTAYFKNYLFGYRIGEDFLVPPWRILHFRNYYPSSPFGEYGVPLYIHAVAPYKQYDMAVSLQIAARKSRLPLLKYKLKFQNMNLSPTEKTERALEFLRELENSGLGPIRREGIGLGERLVTIEELYDVEEETPNIDIGKVDDLQLLYEELFLASLIPRGFIDPNNQTFGNSGVALKQQFIPFARLVLRFQLILLEGLSELVKIHLILKGYPEEDLNGFILSLPFPETQYSTELISSNESALSLANNILDSISAKLGIQGALPIELVYSVYKNFLPIETSKLNRWFLKYLEVLEAQKVQAKAGEASSGGSQGGTDQGGGGGLFGGGQEGGGGLFGGGGGDLFGGGLGGGGGDLFGGGTESTPTTETPPTETGGPTGGGQEGGGAGGETPLTASLKLSAIKYLPKNSQQLKLLKENHQKFQNINLDEYLFEQDFYYYLDSTRLNYKSRITEKDTILRKVNTIYYKSLLKEDQDGKQGTTKRKKSNKRSN